MSMHVFIRSIKSGQFAFTMSVASSTTCSTEKQHTGPHKMQNNKFKSRLPRWLILQTPHNSLCFCSLICLPNYTVVFLPCLIKSFNICHWGTRLACWVTIFSSFSSAVIVWEKWQADIFVLEFFKRTCNLNDKSCNPCSWQGKIARINYAADCNLCCKITLRDAISSADVNLRRKSPISN